MNAVISKQKEVIMYISLNNCEWQVKGFWPYVPILFKSFEIGNELMGVTEWIEAKVPGGIHNDLLTAGIIEDPYYERNSLKCEWVTNRWWMYKCTFTVSEDKRRENCNLILKGIDYKAHIFLNGESLGQHEGMYSNAIFDINGKIDFTKQNELCVLIEHAPEEMAQIGYTHETNTQKARFGYKWDFSTRLINQGIYDDVVLHFFGDSKLGDLHVSTDYDDKKGTINVNYTVDAIKQVSCKTKLTLKYKDDLISVRENVAALEVGDNNLCENFNIDNPLLWYPNGYGQQPLYQLIIEMVDENGSADEKKLDVGIRKIRYMQNEGAVLNSLPYTLAINDKKIYIKGVNMVPLDHIYGCVSEQKYDQFLHMAKEANINLIRVWGGGLIEKEVFYELCDKYGILVWQEFIQSSSGISNVPSTKPKFMELLKISATQAVKEKRNHVCLSVWSGGNELTDENGVPATYENENIKMLKDIVQKYDPHRLMLPTSASGPLEFLDNTKKGQNHDVHGPWKYAGTTDQYNLFNNSDSYLHSEFGVDGMANMDTLKMVLSQENLKVTNMKDNLSWRHHGEWWDTYERDASIFGEFDNLEHFILCSQFIQAEGIRYALEANRRRMFQNSGSILWQMNEPWPNVSCTSIVDYYNNPKMAYYYLKKAYSPIHVSLKYDRLAYVQGDEFTGEIYVHNDLEEFTGKILYEIIDQNNKCLLNHEISMDCGENISLQVCDVNFAIKDIEDMFSIKLTLQKDDSVFTNIYNFFVKNDSGYCKMTKGIFKG